LADPFKQTAQCFESTSGSHWKKIILGEIRAIFM